MPIFHITDTNDNSLFEVENSGRVGIFNASPAYLLDIVNNSSAQGIRLRSTGSTYHDIVFDANRSSGEQAIGRIVGKWNGNVVAYLQIQSGNDSTNKDDGRIKFYTSNSGSSPLERMEILASGQVHIGGANEVQLTASNHEILYLHGAITDPNADHAWGLNIDMDDDAGGTATNDRERGSIHCDFHANSMAGDTSNEMRIWNIHSDVEVSGDYDSAVGMYSDILHSSTGGTATTHIWGVYGLTQKNNTGGVSNMYGMYALTQQTTGSSGTVADMVGIRARVNQCGGSGSGTATDIMAVWANIDNDRGTNAAQPSGGKCALLYGSYDSTTGLSNPHGVYIATDVPNYFKGPVKINDANLTGGDSNAGQTPELYVNGYSNLGGLRVKGGDTGNTIYKEGGNLSITTGTAHHIYLKTNGNDALTITSAGTIRIGSATDNSADIDANHTKLTIKQTANGREDGLYIERSGERKGYYMWMNASGGAGDALTFARNSNGTKEDIMCLDRDGNTFIGGTSRGQDTTLSNLSVYGNSSNTTANIPASFHCANVSSTRSVSYTHLTLPTKRIV